MVVGLVLSFLEAGEVMGHGDEMGSESLAKSFQNKKHLFYSILDLDR